MYVIIDSIKYTAISNISFAPQTDITGDTIPINDLSVDIETMNSIRVGRYVYLHDDLDNLWAKYWIVFAERIHKNTVRVKAQSTLYSLDNIKLPAIMYNAASLSTVMSAIFARMSASDYSVDNSFASETITGFCPEQTARERLQWVCFCIGAYVKTYFTDKIEILPIDETETVIPRNKTFWRPSISYRDYITAINITGFAFTQGEPSNTDEWVTDGTNYYIITRTVYTLTNPEAPQNVPTRTIDIDKVYLVNSLNVSAILSHLSTLYFKRIELDASVINNYEYEPAQRVGVYIDEFRSASGFIESCDFSFGVQARSKMHLTPIEEKETTVLIITYFCGSIILGKNTYYFPVDYQYSIENPYIDQTDGRHRYVYRPLNQYAIGMMHEGINTKSEQCEVALHYYYDGNILHILSVSGVDWESAEEREVVVIE